MTYSLGVVMDPITAIKVYKDSTFAMMLAAQQRGWKIFYIEQKDIFFQNGVVYAHTFTLTVQDNSDHWFDFIDEQTISLSELDAIFMRKDPPFDLEYIYTTYLLELAEQQGVLVVNKPQSLRDANEKMVTTWFAQCCPPTLVTRDATRLKAFHKQYHDVIFKPLEGMGGMSVFRVKQDDPNLNVIIEMLTHNQQKYIMAQQYIAEIRQTGDKRILLINGEAVPYALARIPPNDDSRGNLAIGGTGVGIELNDRDRWICQQVGPVLRDKGILFAGLDVIGDYLTEINITSPTCIREIEHFFKIDIAGQFIQVIEEKLQTR